MITLNNISVSFDKKCVITGLSANIDTGVTLITGASGSGKTTLLRVLAGLQKAEGEILGVETGDVAMAFQEPRLFPHLTVLEQLTLVGATEDRALALLTAAGLGAEADLYPDQLSGGMRSRVNVLRALASDRPIVLFDEPLTGLDAETAEAVVSLIARETAGKIVVIVTHQSEAFASIAKNQIAL
jgi:ABC-type nitrate/sulfonate/bicarbonate transport system ATPase subunit